MYKNTLYLLLLISLISCSSSGEDINYPESKKISFKENLHGYEITDDYRWLEDFTSDESIDWITRQNEFTQKYIEKNKYKKDLERIGDLSKSNAKKVKPLPLDLPDELLGNLKRLGELVMKQLNDVLDSYVNKNFDKAKEVWEKDEQVDDLTYIAMESVIDFLSKDKKNLDFSTHLIFATKNLERAGDHITNIAETICYLVKGEYLKGRRPKGKVTQE